MEGLGHVRECIREDDGPDKGARGMAARIGVSVAFLGISGFKPEDRAFSMKVIFGKFNGAFCLIIHLVEECLGLREVVTIEPRAQCLGIIKDAVMRGDDGLVNLLLCAGCTGVFEIPSIDLVLL